MRFKEYLTEEQSISGYEKNLSTMIDRNYLLWRGVDTNTLKKIAEFKYKFGENYYETVGVYHVSERTTRRQSATGGNGLMLTTSTSAWEEFPRRDLSSFATQSKQHASDFGKGITLIIPADSTDKFGYTPHDFNCPPRGSVAINMVDRADVIFRTMGYLLSCVYDIIIDKNDRHPIYQEVLDAAKAAGAEEAVTHGNWDEATAYHEGMTKDQFEKVIKFINVLIKKYKSLTNDPYNIKDAVDDLSTKLENLGYATMNDFIEDISPENLGAKVYDFDSLPNEPNKTNEVWFEGSYLAIKILGGMNISLLKDQQIIDILTKLKEL